MNEELKALELRPEVLRFARAMEEVLRKHDGKKWHWTDVSFEFLQNKLTEEFVEVQTELKPLIEYVLKHKLNNFKSRSCFHRNKEELLDLANICMMLFDKISEVERINEEKRQESQ